MFISLKYDSYTFAACFPLYALALEGIPPGYFSTTGCPICKKKYGSGVGVYAGAWFCAGFIPCGWLMLYGE